jgi:hypothetical protein
MLKHFCESDVHLSSPAIIVLVHKEGYLEVPLYFCSRTLFLHQFRVDFIHTRINIFFILQRSPLFAESCMMQSDALPFLLIPKSLVVWTGIRGEFSETQHGKPRIPRLHTGSLCNAITPRKETQTRERTAIFSAPSVPWLFTILQLQSFNFPQLQSFNLLPS